VRRLHKPAWIGLLLLLVISSALNLWFIQDPGHALSARNQLKQWFRQTEEAKFNRELPELAAYFSAQKFANFTDRIDFAREWVATNSVHDESHNLNDQIADTTGLLRKLFSASQGKGDKPGLTCGPRAQLLERIMLAWGLRVRLVSIYFVNYSPDEIGSHTYIEVINPDTRRWEAVDPDNNLYYVDRAGRRLSTLEVGAHPDQVTPVRRPKLSGRQLLVDDYFRLPEAYKLVSLREIGGESLVLLKDGCYDPGKVFKKDGCTLPEYFSGQNVIVY
jgi:hypothetical protein